MSTSVNRISATLTVTDIDKIKKLIEALEKQMPFLVSLDDAARKELHQVGDKSREFIRKALVAAQTHPDMLPRSFDIPEFAKDVELSESMYPLVLAIKRLYKSVEDTYALTLSEAYAASLITYRSARDNDENGTMAAALGDMSSRFARKSTKKTPAPTPAPVPRP